MQLRLRRWDEIFELLLLPGGDRKPSKMGGKRGIVGALATNLAGFLGGIGIELADTASSSSSMATSSESGKTNRGTDCLSMCLLSIFVGDFGETSPCIISEETRIVEGGGGTVISKGRALIFISALLMGTGEDILLGHWKGSLNMLFCCSMSGPPNERDMLAEVSDAAFILLSLPFFCF